MIFSSGSGSRGACPCLLMIEDLAQIALVDHRGRDRRKQSSSSSVTALALGGRPEGRKASSCRLEGLASAKVPRLCLNERGTSSLFPSYGSGSQGLWACPEASRPVSGGWVRGGLFRGAVPKRRRERAQTSSFNEYPPGRRSSQRLWRSLVRRACHPYASFSILTPAPPPFSGMNSTPAVSSSLRHPSGIRFPPAEGRDRLPELRGPMLSAAIQWSLLRFRNLDWLQGQRRGAVQNDPIRREMGSMA